MLSASPIFKCESNHGHISAEYDFCPALPGRIKLNAIFAIILTSLRHFWMISSSKAIQDPFSAIVHSHGIFHKMAI